MRAPTPASMPSINFMQSQGHAGFNSRLQPTDCSTTSFSVSNSNTSAYETISLNLCCLNARGLISNCHYIDDLLSRFDLDLIAISEHWLHDYMNYINVSMAITL